MSPHAVDYACPACDAATENGMCLNWPIGVREPWGTTLGAFPSKVQSPPHMRAASLMTAFEFMHARASHHINLMQETGSHTPWVKPRHPHRDK